MAVGGEVDGPPWAALTGTARHTACVVAARDGDRRALDALVVELSPVLWHVARGQGLDRSTAEDVVQTVWLALLRHVESINEPGALLGWLITTTRRESRRAHQRDGALSADVPGPEPVPESEAVRAERDRTLWRAFHRLDPRCQELLRLAVLAGRAEHRLLAERLHLPPGSIGPTRGRCLNALRVLYYEGDPD
ncbi:sigma-70 family RNA polymerase sigma factor [Actinokineospora auranticolor]|nr:sigma-70 family RNA polymerase sigma factor [Actinokineospora auranticolor]